MYDSFKDLYDSLVQTVVAECRNIEQISVLFVGYNVESTVSCA